MKGKIFYLLAISFMYICSISLAQDYTQIINFSKEDIKIVKNGDYDYLQFEDLEYSQEVGYPQLPMEIVQLSIPNDKEIADIQIEILESEFLDGSYNLFPKQSPQIFSKEETSFNNQNEEVYNSNEPYPKEIIKIENSGFLSRNKIATLTIFPLQYIPSERKLKFISSVKVNLIFKESSTKNIGFRESEYSNQIEIKSLTNLQNEKVELTEKEIDLISASLPSEEHLYLIITSDALESSFQPLANWKLQKGLSEKIVTTSFIYTNYSGRDDAEKVRNFIIDAYQTWGTVWVLLGGDITVVPHRTAYAMDCDGNHNDYIPCDLYYSDLDGNWDANANDIFGEVDDNIDMYPDVFVGRASVENSAEATAFVNKLLVYEKNPPTDYLLDMLFLGEVLWDDPYTDSGIGKDYIDNNYVPERFDPIIKLYESLGNESASNVISEINSGKGIINHNGHAWYDVMGTGIDYIHNYNMDYDLTNISKYGILYSIGCWPGAFDYDCIAEHFISNPNGGGIAFIGNSRYGWGCPGDPIYGYSDRFDQQFYKFLFQENVYNIGQTIASAKSMYVPLASEKNVYRWCEYEINLLGDPEMPIWTDVPKTLTINYPDSFIVGENSCLIAVTDGNNPVANAFVCLMQENGIYETGYTRIDGTINFRINITDPINYIKLTVTAQNYLPSQTDIPIQSNKQYIGIANCSTNGSEDRIINPKETISMDICLKNFGTLTANNVTATLSCSDPNLTLIDFQETIGNISANDSIEIQNAFSFDVVDDLSNEEVIYLDLLISDLDLNEWNYKIGIIVGTPILSHVSYSIDDSLNGNNNKFAEPNENLDLKIKILNEGLLNAQNVTCNISSNSVYLSVNNPSVVIGNIDTLEEAEITVNIDINSSTPIPSFQEIVLLNQTNDGYQFYDTLVLDIGKFLFFDDIETVTSQLTSGKYYDLWHRTQHRSHSGNYSWYCGNEDNYTFDQNLENNCLNLPPVVIGQNYELSFWCWYELPTFGTSGIYIEANDGSGWQKLDFLSSGGALGTLSISKDWYKYEYDLSEYAAGTKLKIRFRFQSDDSPIAEGVYVDDIIVKRKDYDIESHIPSIPPSTIVELSELNDEILIDWGTNPTRTTEIESFNQDGYVFQGYNVYQLTSDFALKENPERIATFDIIDGITSIKSEMIDTLKGLPLDSTIQFGTDSGIQRSIAINIDHIDGSELIKGKPYYYAVTSYTYNPNLDGKKNNSEGLIQLFEIKYKEDEPGIAYGDTINITHDNGSCDASITVIVKNPNELTGHNYIITFDTLSNGDWFWKLTDTNLGSIILNNQTNFDGDLFSPSIDGFQLFVKVDFDANNDFYYYTLSRSGGEPVVFYADPYEYPYGLASYTYYGWSPTARCIDVFGKGTTNRSILNKDYELRFTGEYENVGDIYYIKNGTGSIATIYDASYYYLADHPMNPNPGSNEIFAIRIPFEIWNIDDKQQVNILIWDRYQFLSNVPFYAFNPNGRMYCQILNTPYSETAADTSSTDMNNLTWNLVFFSADWLKNDIIRIYYYNPITKEDVFTFNSKIIDSINNPEIPKKFSLLQNYPNPFNPNTTIEFNLPVSVFVRLNIYNILGEKVVELKNEIMDAGIHKVRFNGSNLSSGVYFYRLEAGDFIEVKKMIYLK